MKKLFIGVLTLTILFLSTITVDAKNSPSPNGNGSAGNSRRAHLYLYEKDSSFVRVEGGAWGKMAYDQIGEVFDFIFNGHRLSAGEEYTLIYYPDPWPGNNLICLGSGKANNGGEVNIKGMIDTGDLPRSYDDNYHKWDISGTWSLDFAGGIANREFRNLVQDNDGNVTGEFWWLNNSNDWEKGGLLNGYVSGNGLYLYYDRDPIPYTGVFEGTIDKDGMTGNFVASSGFRGEWSTDGHPAYMGGAKIWLVKSGDVKCLNSSHMVNWNPSEYLFEYDLINFVKQTE